MNLYEKRYNRVINHFKNIQLEGYTENHHIIPRCMGGNDSKENLVRLTAKAHYVAHHLLYKAFPGNKKLANAFGMMLCGGKKQERRFSAKMYENSRIAVAESKRGVPRPDLAERNRARRKPPKIKIKKENHNPFEKYNNLVKEYGFSSS